MAATLATIANPIMLVGDTYFQASSFFMAAKSDRVMIRQCKHAKPVDILQRILSKLMEEIINTFKT